MSKRKFDYLEFDDGYGVLFDSDSYTQEEAINVYLSEYGDRVNYNKDDIVLLEDYIKWYPKMSKEDMWYFDIYDPADNRGIYKCCKKGTPKSFKVWRLRSKEEVIKYGND